MSIYFDMSKQFGLQAREMPTKVEIPGYSQSLILTESDHFPIGWSGLIELIGSAVWAYHSVIMKVWWKYPSIHFLIELTNRPIMLGGQITNTSDEYMITVVCIVFDILHIQPANTETIASNEIVFYIISFYPQYTTKQKYISACWWLISFKLLLSHYSWA